ncbi:hypothetical protein QQF64_024443, partial [Cirrhinus molitorella]
MDLKLSYVEFCASLLNPVMQQALLPIGPAEGACSGGKRMDGKLFTDSEQDWSSSSESDWMNEKGKRIRKQGVKRKKNQQNGNKKKIARSKNSNCPGVDLTDIFQEVRKKDQLDVHCGKMAGCLYRIKYDNGEKCISCKGRWFTPMRFEKFGGKGHYKKWKASIYYKPSNGLQQVNLLKLIQNGCLSEFGQQGKSIRKVTKTESHKILFSKIPKIPVCRIEDEIIQLDSSSDESVSVAERVKKNKRESVIFTEDLSKRITEPVESTTSAKDSSSDESVSVAKRVKMNRRESLILAKTVRKTITELDKSTASARDLHAPPTDATESAVSGQLRQSIREVTQTKSWERLFSKSLAIPVCRIDKETIQLDSLAPLTGGAEPAVSPVVEEADQTIDEAAGAASPAQLNFSDSPADATEPAVSPVSSYLRSADQTTDEVAGEAQLNFSDFPTDATEPAVSSVVEEADQTTDEATAAQLDFSDCLVDATEPAESPVIEEADQIPDEATAAQLNFSDSATDAKETAVSPVIEEADQTKAEAAGAAETTAQMNSSDSPTDATDSAVSSVIQEADQTTDEATAALLNFSDSPTDATEPAVSPVIGEASQTTDEAEGEAAAQLNFNNSPAESQNLVASEETDKTGQMQLLKFMENQFNTMNSTLKAIELSLKKLVEKQSQNTQPQYIYLIPAVIEKSQVHSLVKKEPITEAEAKISRAYFSVSYERPLLVLFRPLSLYLQSDDSSESAAVFEEVEEMDGELFTDSEQDCGRASESDWKNETGKGKQAVKRKMNQQNRTKNKIAKGKYPRLPDLKKMNAESVMKQTKPESELKKNSSETGFNEDADRKRMKEKMKRQRCSKQSNNKRPFSSHVSNDTGVKLSDVFQEVRNKKQLAVRCGKIAGCLYRIKYDNGEKCILCKGKWFTPNQFEEFGGKGHHKKWKGSISYKPSNGLQQVKLWKLIQNGCLSEFGQLRESVKEVTQADRDGTNSVQNVMRRSELINSLKGFPESWKRLFSKTLEIPVCGIQEEAVQPNISSDESVSVAERVKMNRRETVISAETLSKKITEPVESTASARDSPAPPTDATDPTISPVVEEDDRTTDEAAATAAQLNFSDSPAEWQHPVASEETEKTGQMQLFEFLANQFNTINNTLKSIDLSLQKL